MLKIKPVTSLLKMALHPISINSERILWPSRNFACFHGFHVYQMCRSVHQFPTTRKYLKTLQEHQRQRLPFERIRLWSSKSDGGKGKEPEKAGDKKDGDGKDIKKICQKFLEEKKKNETKDAAGDKKDGKKEGDKKDSKKAAGDKKDGKKEDDKKDCKKAADDKKDGKKEGDKKDCKKACSDKKDSKKVDAKKQSKEAAGDKKDGKKGGDKKEKKECKKICKSDGGKEKKSQKAASAKEDSKKECSKKKKETGKKPCNKICKDDKKKKAKEAVAQKKKAGNKKKTKKCDSDEEDDGDDGGESKPANLSAVLHKACDLRLEERPMPKIRQQDVLIAMDTIGICGQDVHYLKDGKLGKYELKAPMVLGHEGSGIVAKVGKKVKSLKEGDRVAIEPGIPCGTCELCMAGRYNICPQMVFCATPPHDGNMCTFFKHSPRYCYKLCDHMTMEEGALVEHLAIGVGACRRAGIRLGADVLIIGAGPIGLSTLLAAQAFGAASIVVSDVKEERLRVANKLNASAVMKTPSCMQLEDVIAAVKNNFGDKLPNITFDASGSEFGCQIAVHVTRPGGCVTLIGCPHSEVKMPLIEAFSKEVDIRASYHYCNDYPAALALAESGVVNIKGLVSHHFDLTELEKAFEMASSGKAMKILVHAQKRDTNNPFPFSEEEEQK